MLYAKYHITEREKKPQQTLPWLLHEAAASRAMTSCPTAGSDSAGAKLHKWFELKDSEGGYKRYL